MTKLLERHLEGPGGIRQMVAIALPMVVSNFVRTVMTFTDRLFLSRLGPEFMSDYGRRAGEFFPDDIFLGLTRLHDGDGAQYLGNGRTKYALTVTQAARDRAGGLPDYTGGSTAGTVALFDVLDIPQVQREPQRLYFDILVYGSFIALLRNCLSCFSPPSAEPEL